MAERPSVPNRRWRSCDFVVLPRIGNAREFDASDRSAPHHERANQAFVAALLPRGTGRGLEILERSLFIAVEPTANTILDQFEEIATFAVTDWGEAPVVQDEKIGLGERQHQLPVGAIN